MTSSGPSPGRRPSPGHHRLCLVGAGLVLLLAVSVVVLAVAARAVPARLVSVVPADGARLAAPPSTVSLTFNARLDPRRSHASMTSTGGAVTYGASQASGRALVLPTMITGDGAYLIGYHVVFGDGREVSGVARFTVVSEPPATGASTGATQVAIAPEPTAVAGDGHQHGTDSLTLVVIVVDALALAAAAAVMVARRRPHRRRARRPSGL